MGTREDTVASHRRAARSDASMWFWFETFVAESSERLRRGFVARYGVEIGTEVYGDVLAWAVAHTGLDTASAVSADVPAGTSCAP